MEPRPDEKTGQVPPRGGKVGRNNPFKSGFKPNGKRRNKGHSYLHRKTLLKYMLEVDITIVDLPTKLADELRAMLPGFFEEVDRPFTFRQIVELTQLQLLFSKSDYVKQDAINAIKDRVEGKPMQRVKMESTEEAEPTQIILPNGRKIIL